MTGVIATLLVQSRTERARWAREDVQRTRAELTERSARLRPQRLEFFIEVGKHLADWTRSCQAWIQNADDVGDVRP